MTSLSLSQLSHLASTLEQLFAHLDTSFPAEDERFPFLQVGLVSTQALRRQLMEFMNGDAGLRAQYQWHRDEADCVVEVLTQVAAVAERLQAKQMEETGRSSTIQLASEIQAGVDHLYAQAAAALNHEGWSTASGSSGVAAAPKVVVESMRAEPEGRSVSLLLHEFTALELGNVYATVHRWQKCAQAVVATAQVLHRMGEDLSRVEDAQEALQPLGWGMHRWAESVTALGESASVMAGRLSRWGTLYAEFMDGAEEVGSQRRKALQHPSFGSVPFPERQFTQRLDQLLSTVYNTGLAQVDMEGMELPCPLPVVVLASPPITPGTLPLNSYDVSATGKWVEAGTRASSPLP